jgi:glucokinase
METALAIELEGARIAVGAVDRAGHVHESEAVEPNGERTGGTYELLAECIERVRSRTARHGGQIVVCGISIGGGDDLDGTTADGGVADSRAADRLRGRLSTLVGVPVYADTEGRGFALGEGWVGAAKGCNNFVAMLVGHTVRGGAVVDGRLLDGSLGAAGRIGHVMVEPDGRRCACGARGCLQSEVSIDAIESASGRPLTEPTYDVMRRVGQLIGRAGAAAATLLDVGLIVCGGRVAREYASTLFLAAQEEIDQLCRLPFDKGARIVSARTPSPSGLISAAAIGWRGLAMAGG